MNFRGYNFDTNDERNYQENLQSDYEYMPTASPPSPLHPLSTNLVLKPSRTGRGCKGEEILTTVVRSLLAALRKNAKPIANNMVKVNVEIYDDCIPK